MPVFFFFFFSTCYSDFRLKWLDLLHLTPSALVLVLGGPWADETGWVRAFFLIDTRQSWVLSQFIYFGYMAAIIALLWRFRIRFRLHHAGGRSEVLIWLTQLAVASLFARIVIVTRDLLSFTSANSIVLFLQMAGALIALAITSWIAMKSLLSPQLFRDVDRRLLGLAKQNVQTSRADLERLNTHIETQKAYLDPDLTLASLSDQVALTPRELSELLNQTLGLHFFDFVNGHRIRHAQELLLAHPKRSILQILNECGFHSKSSFNTAFKKHVGMTPSAYRSSLKAE